MTDRQAEIEAAEEKYEANEKKNHTLNTGGVLDSSLFFSLP